MGSTYFGGPAIPIIGVAASNFFFTQFVGRNFANGFYVTVDVFVKLAKRPYCASKA
jgi:hypothetical protein